MNSTVTGVRQKARRRPGRKSARALVWNNPAERHGAPVDAAMATAAYAVGACIVFWLAVVAWVIW